MPENDSDAVRLVKYLSSAGVASRRSAGELVKSGLVTVNGQVISEPGFRVASGDTVCVNGVTAVPQSRKVYIMLNKPRGCTCSNADRHAEHLAVELIDLHREFRLFSAGRLDKESEGLIIFSNDGDFVAELTHPRNEILKTYLVKASCRIAPEYLAKMRDGIMDDGELLRAKSVEFLGNTDYRIVLNEGRKREIRRMLAAAGARTLRLRRVKIGNLELGTLKPGQWRELSAAEIKKALVSDRQS